jgi:hypothetical protein
LIGIAATLREIDEEIFLQRGRARHPRAHQRCANRFALRHLDFLRDTPKCTLTYLGKKTLKHSA